MFIVTSFVKEKDLPHLAEWFLKFPVFRTDIRLQRSKAVFSSSFFFFFKHAETETQEGEAILLKLVSASDRDRASAQGSRPQVQCSIPTPSAPDVKRYLLPHEDKYFVEKVIYHLSGSSSYKITREKETYQETKFSSTLMNK